MSDHPTIPGNWHAGGLNVDACRRQFDEWVRQARGSGSAIREAAKAAVIEWKWSNFWMWSPLPFWFESGGYPRGRAFKEPPQKPDYHHIATGFDAEGRVRVERLYTDIMREEVRWYEDTIFEYHEDRIAWATYAHAPTRDLEDAHCAWLVDGQVVLVGHHAVRSMDQAKTWFEHYDWSVRGKLRIDRNDLDDSEHRGMHQVADVDDQGRLLEFRQEQPGCEPWIKWRRPSRGVSVESIGRKVLAELKTRIVEALRNWKGPGPAYCLAISYDDEGNDMFPPNIGVGLDAERKQWAAEHPDDLRYYLWNPAEFSNFATDELYLGLPGLEEDVRMLNQLIAENDACDEGVRMIRSLAADLGKLDWSRTLSITDDFMVFSVGTELAALEADLMACLGDKKLNSLKKADLIP